MPQLDGWVFDRAVPLDEFCDYLRREGLKVVGSEWRDGDVQVFVAPAPQESDTLADLPLFASKADTIG